ncbi:DUF1642 domain-containing protein [Listeria monocytogenes]|nr:DUF1642 domain-containing protein [Listeria monocytogenes]EHV5293042.1 DUF1642 domain-containing protein [Listeria monocytogenes]
MRFKKGDKVEFIYGGTLIQGVVNEIRATNHDISYQIVYFGGEKKIWFAERELLSPAPVLKVPQFVADWIEQKKANGDDLYIAMDTSWQCMNDKVSGWLEDREDSYDKFARAWLDGYEVEKEPLYYVKLPYFGYVTNRMDYTLSQSKTDAVMLTESKIKRMDERYWQFAVPVKDLECEA